MDLLPIYLQDHLALSLGGLRLARRCRDENARTFAALEERAAGHHAALERLRQHAADDAFLPAPVTPGRAAPPRRARYARGS